MADFKVKLIQIPIIPSLSPGTPEFREDRRAHMSTLMSIYEMSKKERTCPRCGENKSPTKPQCFSCLSTSVLSLHYLSEQTKECKFHGINFCPKCDKFMPSFMKKCPSCFYKRS